MAELETRVAQALKDALAEAVTDAGTPLVIIGQLVVNVSMGQDAQSKEGGR